MFDKSFLTNRVVKSLLAKDYDVLVTRGCFDIAAKGLEEKKRSRRLMLVKTLMNIDGLAPQQALSLRAVSYFMSAYPFVISMKTNREFLSSKMVYNRFDLPVVTPDMFDSILEEDAYDMQAAKGRHTVTIDAGALRQIRQKMKFTLDELSRLVGISKKALYEIEAKRVNPSVKTVKKLEMILNTKLKSVYEPKPANETRIKPRGAFQTKVSKEFNRLGIENSSVYSSPFEIIGKEDFQIITGLSINMKKIKRDAQSVKKISNIFSSKAFYVVKQVDEKEIEGVSIIHEDELPEVDSAKALKKLIEEKI